MFFKNKLYCNNHRTNNSMIVKYKHSCHTQLVAPERHCSRPERHCCHSNVHYEKVFKIFKLLHIMHYDILCPPKIIICENFRRKSAILTIFKSVGSHLPVFVSNEDRFVHLDYSLLSCDLVFPSHKDHELARPYLFVH